MLEKYKEKQHFFYSFINMSFENNKLSHAYLFETNGVSYAKDLVLDFAKFLLCDGKYNEKVCNLIDQGNYPNFIIIDDEKTIKKETILKLQKSFSLKDTNNGKLVYFITDASLLNSSSANSLLKFLEEPEEGIIAILMANNVNNVIETIKSRCQIISLVQNEDFDYKSIFTYYDNFDDMNFESFVDAELQLFLNFYRNLESEGTLVLRDKNIYEINSKIKYILLFGLYLYMDAINNKLGRTSNRFLPCDDILNIICDNNDLNSLINKTQIINDFLQNINYNINGNLFLDSFVIKMGR